MKWSAAKRKKAIAALDASLVDGVPRFDAVAEAVAVPARTLRTWWKAKRPRSEPRPAVEPPSVAGDRRAFQVGLLEKTERALTSAIEAGSWTAVGTLTRRLRDLRNELDEMDAAALAAQGGINESTVDAMTEEEFLDRLRDVARGTADAYLEVYVAEYMERHGLRFLGATGVG